MANQNPKVSNLIPMSERTPEERSMYGKMGAIKSAEVRKARKTLKEELTALLSTDKWQENITLALLKEAVSGNVKAFEVLRDTIGEKQTDKVEATIRQDKLDSILSELKDEDREEV